MYRSTTYSVLSLVAIGCGMLGAMPKASSCQEFEVSVSSSGQLLIQIAPLHKLLDKPSQQELERLVQTKPLDASSVAKVEKLLKISLEPKVNVESGKANSKPKGRSSAPAILGKFGIPSNKQISFRPRFQFQPGIRLRIELFDPLDQRLVAATVFDVPRSNAGPPKIVTVYPTADVLPENLLKFYVHFSKSMKTGDIYQYLQLMNVDTGKPVELPFLELEQELWDRERKRITLLLDPGRIKRGLKPRLEEGPIFEKKNTYRLTISRKWQDEDGVALGEDYRKDFRVSAMDSDSPKPKQWTIKSPAASSREPLAVTFAEPLDAALAQRVIRVFKVENQSSPVLRREVLEETIRLEQHEIVWKFVPKVAWQTGSYRLTIGSELEDLCGNRIDRAFDVDLEKSPKVETDQRVPNPETSRSHVLMFKIEAD